MTGFWSGFLASARREMLDASLGKETSQTPGLGDIRGIGADREASGGRYDEFLYGKNGRR